MTGLTRPITRAVTRPVTRGLTEPFGRRPLNAQLSFWLPLTDLGAGQVNTTPAFASGAPTPSFTRATTAWAKLGSGLWAQVASGVARSHYLGADTTAGAYGGYLAEEARTNECLQSRDFTQAAWTKATMTATKDQAGIDGAAASASSLLATGANATVKQAIVSASAARRFSVFVKRLAGTGNVDLTLDNGTTWTTISGSINAATYTRVGAGQTLANPTVGIRIVTSGDKIAVDMAQEEVGAFDTSPIPTGAATVTRNADQLVYANLDISETVGSAAATFTSSDPNNLTGIIGAGGVIGAATFLGAQVNGTQAFAYDGTSVPITGAAGVAGALHQAASSWATGGNLSSYINGAGKASAAYDGAFGAGGAIGVGARQNLYVNGVVANLRMWKRALSDAEIAAIPA